MNSITELLNLEDADIKISDIDIQGTTKILTLETKLYAHHCPSCGYRMYSRGVKKRTIKHPILQDGYELILVLKQRRWMCTNPECRYNISDSFKFVNKSRRVTNATDMLIGEPIDLLRSRRKDVTEPYFANLPPEEKNAVKYPS